MTADEVLQPARTTAFRTMLAGPSLIVAYQANRWHCRHDEHELFVPEALSSTIASRWVCLAIR